MHLINFQIPDMVNILFLALSLTFILAALRYAPWRALLAASERQHAYFAGLVALTLLWKMDITWVKGLLLHPIGMATFTVVFGWHLAVLAGMVATVLFVVINDGQLMMLPADFLLTVIIPATVTYSVLGVVLRLKSSNLFLYMLGGGFVSAIIGLLVSVVSVLLLAYAIDNQYFVKRILEEAVFIIMILNTEGFLNGMLVAAMTVFAPDLVKTFDNRKYFGEK